MTVSKKTILRSPQLKSTLISLDPLINSNILYGLINVRIMNVKICSLSLRYGSNCKVVRTWTERLYTKYQLNQVTLAIPLHNPTTFHDVLYFPNIEMCITFIILKCIMYVCTVSILTCVSHICKPYEAFLSCAQSQTSSSKAMSHVLFTSPFRTTLICVLPPCSIICPVWPIPTSSVGSAWYLQQ